MRRTWHVEARSVRPDHRMVGHTGFLTTAAGWGVRVAATEACRSTGRGASRRKAAA